MSWESATVIAGGICTLVIFSFLIRENRVYRAFEHLFIGIAAGFGPILTVKNFLWPTILEPLLGLNVEIFPDGTVATPYNPLYLLYLVPLAFGMLYYFVYSHRYAWLAKLVIGLSLGFSAGLGIKGFFAEMLPQVRSSLKPLLVMHDGAFQLATSFNNVVFCACLLLVLAYFLTTFKGVGQSQHTRYHTAARWVMMVCFGAFFGSTVMARMALLVERVDFLTVRWLGVISGAG
jgi:hypothetical protein